MSFCEYNHNCTLYKTFCSCANQSACNATRNSLPPAFYCESGQCGKKPPYQHYSLSDFGAGLLTLARIVTWSGHITRHNILYRDHQTLVLLVLVDRIVHSFVCNYDFAAYTHNRQLSEHFVMWGNIKEVTTERDRKRFWGELLSVDSHWMAATNEWECDHITRRSVHYM